MDKRENTPAQIVCPLCGKVFPVRVKRLAGELTLSVRCPHCKRISEIAMQDINR